MMGFTGDDRMHFTPMSHVDIDDDGNLWFFTSTESGKTLNNKVQPIVYLTYVYEAGGTYLSIEGIANITANKAKMRELFNPFLKSWFPKGLEDSAVSLLMVRPLEIEYWVSNENKVLTQHKILIGKDPKRKIRNSIK